MTHNDIYIKFMIEYDKANVTSSYPSLTEYEVATFLDKAYNALIAQKITGNNVRRSGFETDIKSIADLNPLVDSQDIAYLDQHPASNSIVSDMPDEVLYLLQAYMQYTGGNSEYTPHPETFDPIDEVTTRRLPVRLVDHNTAAKFFSSSYNIPWVKEPVCYVEDNQICFVYDPVNTPDIDATDNATITYIKHPNTFVKNLSVPDIYSNGSATFFTFDQGTSQGPGDTLPSNPTVTSSDYVFECNSTVAEELISLAVAFALENVESQRLNSKLNMRGLEA